MSPLPLWEFSFQDRLLLRGNTENPRASPGEVGQDQDPLFSALPKLLNLLTARPLYPVSLGLGQPPNPTVNSRVFANKQKLTSYR